MTDERVSFANAFRHYGVYRWKIERDPARRFEKYWVAVGACSRPDRTKVRLTEVLWALASFERSHETMEHNAIRVEDARNEGVPAVMALLSGSFGSDSLDYHLALSLWMDLADVLVWYRSIRDRLGVLKGSARAGEIPMTAAEIEAECEILDRRTLTEFGNAKVTRLANNLLHHSWHPTKAFEVSIQLYWKGAEGKLVDFAETGDVRASLRQLRGDTATQIANLTERMIA
jgi:hypothetical protein